MVVLRCCGSFVRVLFLSPVVDYGVCGVSCVVDSRIDYHARYDSGLLSCPQILLLRSRNKVNDENKKEYIDNNNNTPFAAATVSRRLKWQHLTTSWHHMWTEQDLRPWYCSSGMVVQYWDTDEHSTRPGLRNWVVTISDTSVNAMHTIIVFLCLVFFFLSDKPCRCSLQMLPFLWSLQWYTFIPLQYSSLYEDQRLARYQGCTHVYLFPSISYTPPKASRSPCPRYSSPWRLTCILWTAGLTKIKGSFFWGAATTHH